MEFLLLLILAMMIPMLLMSRKQKKMQAEHDALVASLEVGDEVRTYSGFYGLIVESYEDVVVLESESGAQLKWDRKAIAGKVEAPEENLAETEESEDKGENGSTPGVTVER
ncbi:preprotein translocase subunit YajC [Dermabacteraceae bacterium TAE3-ERU5]|nr:preprotein translocase subunit YajC [Dermabacteraceae bacterium TAE3-ERU5]